jgi:hypothetical protein
MTIHFVIPTIDFNSMKTKLLASLNEFEGVKDIVTFGLCFQKYKQEDIDYTLNEFKKHGLKVYYIIKEYHFKTEEIPFVQMRDDCAMLNKTADIYGSIDDDNLYSNKFPYCISDVIKAICQYFTENEKCGVVMITHKFDLGVIRPNCLNSPIWTNLGIFMRNIYEGGHIVPTSKLNLVGINEDAFYSRQRTNDGYFDAIAYTPCGAHTEIKKKNELGKFRYRWVDIKEVEGTVIYEMSHALKNKFFNFYQLKLQKKYPQDFIVKKRNF